jgi:hypothetical protein
MIALKLILLLVQVAGKGGAASTIEAGIRATAQLLGEDVGKEVNIDQFSIVDQFSKCRSVRSVDQFEMSISSKWNISSKFRISLKCRSVRKIVNSNQNFDFFQSSLKNLDDHTYKIGASRLSDLKYPFCICFVVVIAVIVVPGHKDFASHVRPSLVRRRDHRVRRRDDDLRHLPVERRSSNFGRKGKRRSYGYPVN